MKRVLLSVALSAPIILNAQTEFSSFTSTGRGGATTFATDYQTVGINPASLGWKNPYQKRVTMGYSEFTLSIYSEALTKVELRENISSIWKKDESNKFTRDEKIQAAKNFTDAGFAINADLGSVGFCFQNEKIGGLAFRINDRFQWYSKLGKSASELLFLGFNAPYFDNLVYNTGSGYDTIPNRPDISQDSLNNVVLGFSNSPQLISKILDGSVLQMSWTREYNLSYGRKIIGDDSTFALYGGVGIKYFQGLAYMDVTSAGGNLAAFSAITPAFDIDYGTAANSNPSTVTQSGTFPRPVGNGFGFDIGFNAILFGKLKIGAALTNIGNMVWDGNVYSMQDTLVVDTDNPGLENYNIFTQLNDIAGDQGLFKWEGETSRTVKLPTAYRFGASLKLGTKAEIGIDAIIPGNEVAGNYQNAIIGFGGDLMPVKWVKFSAGFLTGGNYGFQLPVGVTFIAPDGRWEGGIASRDAVTFFSQNGPTLSLSMGFLRFRI